MAPFVVLPACENFNGSNRATARAIPPLEFLRAGASHSYSGHRLFFAAFHRLLDVMLLHK